MRRGALGLATAALSTLLVTTGLTAPPVAADTVTKTLPSTGTVTLAGHGYGHGHGLSQYGAQGAALGGPTWAPQTWQQILKFYYPGTAQGEFKKTVRVHISADTTRDVVVAPRNGLAVVNRGTNEIRRVPTDIGAVYWRLAVAADNSTSVDYKKDGVWTRWWGFPSDGAFGASGFPMRLYYNGTSRQFRGRLQAARPSATSTDRDTVNFISLEDYLRGVVPAEMPATWAPAAVASQAVAARTYAAYELQHPRAAHYDICDTVACQVYGGYDSEHPASNAAIDATKAVVLTYGGAPAFTQFSSSSGGWTSAGSVPYLPAKADPYDAWKKADGTFGNPNHNWEAKIDVAAIEKRTGIFDVVKVDLLRNDGHHVSKLTFTGKRKDGTLVTARVYGDTFRSWFGLKSTYFTF